MSIACDRVQCEHRKEAARGYFVCRCGSGYDYGGGDIKISKSGYCKNYERKPKTTTGCVLT
jgi:hypothetical protein